MPRLKSAIKRVKTSEKSHLRNISFKSKIKTNIKKYDVALSEKNENETIKYFKDSVSILDKAVNKGILPKGTASREKSRLAKKLNVLIKPIQPSEIQKTTKPLKKTETKKISKPTKKPKTKKTAISKKKPVIKKASKTTKKTETKKTKP
ncbi:MAG: 30S ribosomal protein S20 [Candidatus Atribacteria bacterium]